MKKTLLTALSVLAFGCSHQGHQKKFVFQKPEIPSEWESFKFKRLPASLSAEQDKLWDYYSTPYSQIVDKILNDVRDAQVAGDADAPKALGRFLESSSHIYLSSEFFMTTFDSDLKRKSREDSIFELDSYQGLLKNWMIRERLENQIIYVLKSLLIIEADKSHPASALANETLNFTRQKWNEIAEMTGVTASQKLRNKISRLVFQDIFDHFDHELEEMAKQFRQDNPEQDIPVTWALTQRVVKNISLSPEAHLELRKTLKQEISRQSENEIRSSTWVRYAQSSIDLDSQLALPSNVARNPNADVICPSSGSVGNITGSKFPKGSWAITLDDGPHKSYTDIALKAFSDNKVHGSFFWLGQLTSSYPQVVERVKAGGHTLATHSYSHANLPTLGQAGLDKEITQANSINTKAYGFKPKFFRCPYGACGPADGRIRKMIADAGQVHVFWNIDSLDWKDKDSDSIVKRVMTQFDAISPRSGGIILFHDIHPQSVAAVTKLIPILQKRGVQLKSVEEIVSENNEGMACPNSWSPHAQE